MQMEGKIAGSPYLGAHQGEHLEMSSQLEAAVAAQILQQVVTDAASVHLDSCKTS